MSLRPPAMALNAAWSHEDLARAVCDDLVQSGLLKAAPAFIRHDREAQLVEVFRRGGLDGAKALSFSRCEDLGICVREGAHEEVWVEQVLQSLLRMRRRGQREIAAKNRCSCGTGKGCDAKMVEVTTASGDGMHFKLPCAATVVPDLRARVAEELGEHPWRLRFLSGENELQDEDQVPSEVVVVIGEKKHASMTLSQFNSEFSARARRNALVRRTSDRIRRMPHLKIPEGPAEHF
eukprot:TRINITY_DN82254_c0_g1_i1.p1 TRINITY_DN82254_c0_g1~~TRINITY_DN82254_c0_g1_i1.p1  ORF type:complete len:235 (-),score=18.04 TRINITY_DN82254_c0_g1_i1:367-1071(-)